MNGAASVQRVRSVSSVGLSIVFVEFGFNQDIYIARQIVTERLQQVSEQLPPTIKPVLTPISSIMGEIMLVGVTSDNPDVTPMDLRTIADWQIRQRLLSVQGISQIAVIGGELKQFQVLVDPFKLRNFNISLHDVEEATKNANVNSTGGFILRPHTEQLVRNLARVKDIEDLKKSVIPTERNGGIALTLGQVADVRLGGPLAKRGDAGLDGKAAVILTVQKQPGNDTVKLTRAVERELENIQESLPEGVKIHSGIFRQSTFIENAIRNVEEALLHGAATGHLVLPGADAPVVTPRWGIFRSAGPAGLIHMTARDLLTFVQLHLDGGATLDGTRLLSAESVAAMQQPQVQIPNPYTLGSHWGLGWILMTWDGAPVLGHDGATLGQGAFQRSLPEAGLSVALLTNGGAHPRDLFESLFGEVFSELVGVTLPPRPEPRADTDIVQPERYLGRYAREGVEMTVRPAKGGGLEVEICSTSPLSEGQPTPPPLTLLPHDDDVLLAKGEQDEAWTAMVFFELAGERYVHFGARATPRVST
jgi:hypothetical protein